jgi:cytochrome P450
MATEPSVEAEPPPGPDGWPLIGTTREFARDRLGFATRMARTYGDVVHIPVAGGDFYGLFHPDHIRRVLVDDNQRYEKGEFFQRQLSFLGTGVLNAEGEAWRQQRHAVEPAFHPDRIEGYARFMTDYTERAVDSWADGTVRNVHGDMMELTLEIVAKALFDVDLGAAEDEVGEALETIMAATRARTGRLVDIPDWVPTPANRALGRAERTLDRIVDDIIEERRGAADAGDVVSMLVRPEAEGGGGMRDDAVRDEVMTLLLAGHETTAQALTYTWYLLGQHPAVAERLHDELDATLGGDPPTVDDVADLEYTERVIRESMRLYPPVWSIVREPREDVEIGGYRIPAGRTVGLYQWVTHRDPRFWDDPETFDPDRWTDERQEARHPFAYFPFSAGPRRCLGDRFAMLESQLVVATMAQRVTFETLPDTSLDLAPSITLRPRDGLRLRVDAR